MIKDKERVAAKGRGDGDLCGERPRIDSTAYSYCRHPPTFRSSRLARPRRTWRRRFATPCPRIWQGSPKPALERTLRAAVGGPCAMHTELTYNYKHSASHSYTLMANELDETMTIQDGIGTFQAPAGPLAAAVHHQ